MCREYVHKWSDPANIAKSIREVSLEHKSSGWKVRNPGRNLLATHQNTLHDLHFTHIPPAMSQKPVEQWHLPSLQFRVLGYTAYPPKNTLAAVGGREG